jgi:hypothetical protein
MDGKPHDLGPRPEYADYLQAMAMGAREILQWAYRFCAIDADDISAEKRSDELDACLLCKRVAEKTEKKVLTPLMETIEENFRKGVLRRKGLTKADWVHVETQFVTFLKEELHVAIEKELSKTDMTPGEIQTRISICMSQIDYVVHNVINPFRIQD